MTTPAIYRDRARTMSEHADRHEALAVQSGYGQSEDHRKVAQAYRNAAMALFRLAINVEGGGE